MAMVVMLGVIAVTSMVAVVQGLFYRLDCAIRLLFAGTEGENSKNGKTGEEQTHASHRAREITRERPEGKPEEQSEHHMTADEFQWVTQSEAGGLAFWQAYAPTLKVDLSCSALQIGSKLLFIDPIPLAKPALAELAASGTPSGVILTNANHERASALFAKQFGIPIFAPVEALPELSSTTPPVQAFEDGATILGAITTIALPGGAPGETALYWPGNGGVLIFGDALINLDSTGFDFLPDRYCNNAKTLRLSARERLRFHADLSVMAFAHGTPIVTSARERLETLLGSG